jgi:hypothetical protein
MYSHMLQELDHVGGDSFRALSVGCDDKVGAGACCGEPLQLLSVEPGRKLGLAAPGDRARLGMQKDESRGLAAVPPKLSDHRMLLRDGACRVPERREVCYQGGFARSTRTDDHNISRSSTA